MKIQTIGRPLKNMIERYMMDKIKISVDYVVVYIKKRKKYMQSQRAIENNVSDDDKKMKFLSRF